MKIKHLVSILLLSVVMLTSCTKGNKEITSQENIQVEVLKEYLAWSLNIDKTNINYDAKEKQFIAVGKLYFSKNEISERYETANEYKAKLK